MVARLLVVLAVTTGPAAAQPSATDVLLARGQSGSGPGTGGADEGGGELPAPLGDFVKRLNPARVQRAVDGRRGRDVERSDKPRAPEVPLAVFVQTIRPLGGLKYENQLNYLAAGFTGSAPTSQTFAYEYVFADWHAVRAEAIAPAGRLESVAGGYQQTFGVGPDGNWVHGGLVQPEWAVNGSGFVGGSALYTLARKPDRESPWTVTGSAGANRASFANRPLGGAAGGTDRVSGRD